MQHLLQYVGWSSIMTEESFGACRKETGVDENRCWWMLIYKIPPEPSSARVAAWRQLKTQGAVALQQSVWVLPAEPPCQGFFTAMRETIEAGGGSAYVLRVEALDNTPILERFAADRNAEYAELIDRCQAFEAEIAREKTAQKYTFAELTELEDDWAKLQQWFGKIQARDFYTAPRQTEAVTVLAHAETALQTFAQRVYTAEGLQDAPRPDRGR